MAAYQLKLDLLRPEGRRWTALWEHGRLSKDTDLERACDAIVRHAGLDPAQKGVYLRCTMDAHPCFLFDVVEFEDKTPWRAL